MNEEFNPVDNREMLLELMKSDRYLYNNRRLVYHEDEDSHPFCDMDLMFSNLNIDGPGEGNYIVNEILSQLKEYVPGEFYPVRVGVIVDVYYCVMHLFPDGTFNLLHVTYYPSYKTIKVSLVPIDRHITSVGILSKECMFNTLIEHTYGKCIYHCYHKGYVSEGFTKACRDLGIE